MEVNFIPLAINTIDVLTGMMQQFYAIDNYSIDIARSSELAQQFIQNEHLGRAWLIEHNGEICGYIILTFIFSFEYGGRIAFIDELFILPGMQGKGLGKQAINFAKQQITPLAIKLFYLEVENHNQAAQELYLSKGFIMHNRSLMKLKP